MIDCCILCGPRKVSCGLYFLIFIFHSLVPDVPMNDRTYEVANLIARAIFKFLVLADRPSTKLLFLVMIFDNFFYLKVGKSSSFCAAWF